MAVYQYANGTFADSIRDESIWEENTVYPESMWSELGFFLHEKRDGVTLYKNQHENIFSMVFHGKYMDDCVFFRSFPALLEFLRDYEKSIDFFIRKEIDSKSQNKGPWGEG